jgi:hypothetical protein
MPKPGVYHNNRKDLTMVREKKFYPGKLIRTEYDQYDRVAIWRGQFRGETGRVVASVGMKLRLRIENPTESVLARTTGGIVMVYKSSCVLVA